MNLKTLLELIETSSNQLHQCLNDEHEALCNNEYESLVSLAEQKKTLVTQLDELDQKRQQLAGENDFTTFLQNTDPSLELSKLWHRLLEKVRLCQHQNNINGQLLNRRNHMTQEMLNLFTGRQPGDDATYGSNGMTRPSSSNLTKTQV